MRYGIDTPLGAMIAEEEDGRLRALRFAGEGESAPCGESALALRLKGWLDVYFAGRAPEEELPLAPAGTPFQRRVWEAVRAVPFGKTCSYGELARRIGCGSARAVGAALGRNPIWILIPCHRVLGADGALTGYAGGLERKRALLDLEKSAPAPSLEEAAAAIPPGRYRHFKGGEYEVLAVARHSETEEPMVVYRALYGDGGLWVRPARMWLETVERDGKRFRRFQKIEE